MNVEDIQKLEYMKNMKRKFPVNKNREIVRNFMAYLQSYLMLAKNSGCDDEAIKNLNELIKKCKDISLWFINNLKKDIQKE